MRYEEAIRVWGAARLTAKELESDNHRLELGRLHRGYGPVKTAVPVAFDPDTVEVKFVFDEGHVCCTTPDPMCYCSQATPPVAEVSITGASVDGSLRSCTTIEASEFDFVAVLGEVVAAGGGTVTAE